MVILIEFFRRGSNKFYNDIVKFDNTIEYNQVKDLIATIVKFIDNKSDNKTDENLGEHKKYENGELNNVK